MKNIILYIAFLLAIPASIFGQYTGSIGGGDAMTSSGSIYLDDNYFCTGGVGRGDALSMIFLPTVSTQAATSITTTTATFNGTVVTVGIPNLTQYGFVWSTTSNPTVALTTKTSLGSVSTSMAYTSAITSLLPNTLYYVRSYATNSLGTNYGNEVTFKTIPLQLNVLPTATIDGTAGSTKNIIVTSTTTWTAQTNEEWLSMNTTTSSTSSTTITLKATVNPEITTRSALITFTGIGAKDTTVVVTQAAGAATLSVSATTTAVSKDEDSATSVTVTSNSPWTATSDQTWLTASGATTGNGTLTCTATSANPLITTRIATVTISALNATDKKVTVTQAKGDATLLVSANTAAVAKTINSKDTVNVTSNSTWTATSSDITWLTVTTSGTALIVKAITANPAITTRSAIITITALNAPTKTVTVTQAAGDATLSVSDNTVSVSKAINSTKSINVTSNSTWTTISDSDWLKVTSGATGSGTITFTTLAANPFITSRIATVTISALNAADKTVTVTQAVGDATLTVSSNTVAVAKTANSIATVSVTSNSTWTAKSSDLTWLTVSGETTGNGTLTFTTTTNPLITTRIATVTLKLASVIYQTITVTQAAGDTVLTLSSTTATVAKAINSTATVNITTNTTWTATSSDITWLTVTTSATALTVKAITANPALTTRSAIVTIKAANVSDQIVTVTQAVGDATLSVTPITASIAKTANSTASVAVTSNSTWTATSSDITWLTVTPGATGNGVLTFTAVSDNPAINTRSAIVTLTAPNANNKTVTVTQAVGDATLSVSANTVDIAKAANSTTPITITSNSSWTATSSDLTWLTVTKSGSTLTVKAITANPYITTRIATVTIKATGVANQTITVTQAVGDATLSVSSNNSTVSKSLNSISSIAVTSNTKWTADLDQNWLTVSEGTTGNGQLTFTTLSINKEITTRFATVTLKANGAANQTVIVTQEVGDPTLSVSNSMVSIDKSANSIADIIVYTNSSWTAASDKTWLNVTAGAASYGKLTCTAVTSNPYLTTRSAIVIIKVTGAADKTIYVTQAVGDAAVSVSVPSLSIAKIANSTASVTVYSNTTWEVTSDATWLTVSQGTSGDGLLTICTTASNPEITTRSATVIIKASGSDDKTIIVTQEAGDGTLSLSANTVDVAKTVGSSASVSVTSNSAWTASSNQSWLSVTAGATGDGTLAINTTAANPTISQRIATVIVKANGALDQSITVTQAMGDTTLIGWQFGTPESLGDENTYTATTNDTDLNTSILKRGTGILKYSLPRGFSSNTWNSSTLTNAISTNEYFEFSIQPKSGYSTSLNALNVVLRRSATGPKNYMWRYSTDGTTFNDISGGTVPSSAVAEEGTEQTQISLESITALQNIASETNVTFRIYAWGATNKDGTFAIGKTPAKTLANSLAVSGSVVRLPFITTSVSKVNLGVAANTNSSVNVTSNTTWSVTSDQNWLTVTSSNNDNATLTLTATSSNLMADARTATVTLKATNVVDKTITVTQAGSAPYLSLSTDNVSINASEYNTASIPIESNATWTATSNAGWLTVGGATIGDAILKVTATDTQEASRQATITISAQGVPDKIVTVTQTWGVSAYKYQMNMTVTAIVTVNDKELSTSDLQLSVFIGDECRGLANLQYVDACKRYMAFIMVRGNSEDMNKIVTFRSLNLTNNIELSAINATLGFMPESRTGSAASPYPIRFAQMVTSVNLENNQNVRVYPNPVKDVLHIDCEPGDIQELQLTDATGRNLIGFTKMNTNYINTSHLVKGVYFLHIKCNGSMSVHKIVKR